MDDSFFQKLNNLPFNLEHKKVICLSDIVSFFKVLKLKQHSNIQYIQLNRYRLCLLIGYGKLEIYLVFGLCHMQQYTMGT